MKTVAVLFARVDSCYKTMPECDVYDIERDARTWPGGCPVVAHPPCRTWGTLSHLFEHPNGERDLARWAVDNVRSYGGVLEHPSKSRLWREYPLPMPGRRDAWGGWTLPIDQNWWGHRARKRTFLYIVGCAPSRVPPLPLVLGEPTHVISQNRTLSDGTRLRKGMPGWKPDVTEAEQEHTPPALARWLVDLAARCAVKEDAHA